jgi:hypothetical protein
MVATRRGANKAPEAAPATSMLNAPPKRGGRKKALAEDAAEPAPATAKPTKPTVTKRKAKAEPEDAEMPPAKKPAANTKATRATKVATKATPAPAAPKRATRGTKVAEPEAVPEPEAIPEPAVVEEAPKPAATRGRKAAVKKAPAPKIEEPFIVEETAAVEEPIVEEATKPATRGRKAPAAKKPVGTKRAKLDVVEEPVAVEAPKPASRARKAAAPKPSLPPLPVPASRSTRGRNAAVATAEASPLKAPARKPAKKAAAVVAKAEPVLLEEPAKKPAKKATAVVEPTPVEEPFSEFPGYPTTPAHIIAPMTTKDLLAELPAGYPKTPAHIKAPITDKDALDALPAGYPNTPAHIVPPFAPVTTKDLFDELPGYPKTPAHIVAPVAPMSTKTLFAQLPAGYPNTPGHMTAPILPMAAESKEVGEDLVEYVNSAAINSPVAKSPVAKSPVIRSSIVDSPVVHSPVVELPVANSPVAESPVVDLPVVNSPVLNATVTNSPVFKSSVVNSPVLADSTSTHNVTVELPGSPDTPAYIQALQAKKDALEEVPSSPQTPTRITTPPSTRRALAELPVDYVNKTPATITAPTPSTIGLRDLPADCFGTPAHFSSPVIDEEAAAESIEGPQTPQQLVWNVTNQEAFEELPSYPTTPAHALEAALQEEITASVKKQTPSPHRFTTANDVSYQSEEVSEITENSEALDFDPVDIDTEELVAQPMPKLQFESVAQPMPKLQFAPITLSANAPAVGMASPVKSALRSPQKLEAKTPKKAVTWDDKEESDLFLFDGPRPFIGLTFFVDITSNGKEHNYVFASLLEDLGANIANEWSTGITHVLFKDGKVETLEKVIASKGAIKCVNVGWVLECEENKTRVDEAKYLVDLSVAMPSSPSPTKVMNPFTPARTPSRYALPPSSQCKSMPSTPTSSEFDRSINIDDEEDDDKENSDVGLYFRGVLGVKGGAPRTCPNKKSSVLLSRSPMKTPSKLKFLATTPMKPFSTTKKRTLDSSSLGLSMSVPPKKLRLF